MPGLLQGCMWQCTASGGPRIGAMRLGSTSWHVPERAWLDLNCGKYVLYLIPLAVSVLMPSSLGLNRNQCEVVHCLWSSDRQAHGWVVHAEKSPCLDKNVIKDVHHL